MSDNYKPSLAIQDRIVTNKQLVVKQLKKTPIVQVVCEKLNIGRSSYYRWRKEDSEFEKQTDQAIQEGNLLVNDMAESQLMAAIRDRHMTAIIFWLKHHHSAYATKVEITTPQNNKDEPLSDEQEKTLKEALQLASLLPSAHSQNTQNG